MWSRKMGLILTDGRFHSVELNGKWSRKHKTCFKRREHTLKTVLRHFEGCWDLFSSKTLSATLQKVAKTLKTFRARSASITLLWNKSRTNWLLLPLRRSIFGRCNLPWVLLEEATKERPIGNCSYKRGKKQRKKRTSPKRPIRSLYRRPHVMILVQSGVNNDRWRWI